MKKRNVLFIDDDVIILQSLERGLLDESYNKFFAKNSEEAFEILQQEEINIIVTDMCMPDMTGLELLRTVRKDNPNIIGIVLSGYDKDEDLKCAVEQREIFKIIMKPWKLGDTNFESIIRQAVDRCNLQFGPGDSKGGTITKLKKWIKSGSDN